MRGLVATAAISAGLLVLIAIMLIAGGALELAGVKSLGVFRWPIAVTFFGLILAFAFSTIPLMLKLVLALQVWLGNAGVPPIKAAIEHQRVIVAAIWAVMALGCAVAIPAAILDGFGTGGSPFRDVVAHLPSQGTLVTAPGLTIRQTIDASSLKLALGSKSALFSRAQLGGAAIFDFRVAGTGLRLDRCRYYYITTYLRDRTRIEQVNVGTSPAATSRAGVERLDAALRGKLIRDGWLAGFEVYRTDEDRRLHGGLTHGPQGRLWLKRTIVLDIERNRVDDPVTGEDPATAGRWIQYIDLLKRADYPWIERYAFVRPHR